MTQQSQFFPTIGKVVEDTSKDSTEAEAVVTGADDTDDAPVQEIESLCMSCHEQGVTRMLLTSIPYFKEVIIASFRCEHCGTQNNEIQSAGEIRPEGTVYTVRVLTRGDLNRQLVKSPTCIVTLPEFELTIPAGKGQLTTVEGLLRDVVADLSGDQPVRKHLDPENYEKIENLLNRLREELPDAAVDVDEVNNAGGAVVHHTDESERDENSPVKPFTIRLDDPSGNSFLEFTGSTADPKWNLRTYARNREQNVLLGLIAPEDSSIPEIREEDENSALESGKENEEVYVFPGICSSCSSPLDTRMKKVVIPYFKDILIMSTNCDRCGYRDNEVKSGAAISDHGKRITLKVEDSEDLSRDILKSETCGLTIPEIDLVLHAGTLGGRFTTLEGILDQVYEELSLKVFSTGDSSSSEDRNQFESFLSKLKAVKSAEQPFTLILDDPLANSYLQNLYAPDPDPNMTTETYERTWEQNEDLGLNDMKVEGYEEDVEALGEVKVNGTNTTPA